jgi:hypothetical protein
VDFVDLTTVAHRCFQAGGCLLERLEAVAAASTFELVGRPAQILPIFVSGLGLQRCDPIGDLLPKEFHDFAEHGIGFE